MWHYYSENDISIYAVNNKNYNKTAIFAINCSMAALLSTDSKFVKRITGNSVSIKVIFIF